MRIINVVRKGFLVAIIVLVSCDDGIQDVSDNQIYPINTNNTWTYRRTAMRSTETVSCDTIKLKVEEPIKVYGMSCFKCLNIEIKSIYNLVGNDREGNYLTYGYLDDSTSMIVKSVKFKRNAKKDDQWSYRSLYFDWYSGSSPYTYTIKCISTDTLIQTPNYQMYCMAFQYFIDDVEFVNYLSDNVGIVKTEINLNDDFQRRICDELIEYQLFR